METVQTYIQILIDTLQKKREVLEQLHSATEQQKLLLQQAGSFDEDEFQGTIDGKRKLLEELEELDHGFEQVYERIAPALRHNKDRYREEIVSAQQLIQKILDLNVAIRVLEEQNKERFPICLMQKRSQIRKFKMSSRAATNYYKNMPNTHQEGQSYFMDKKK